MDGIGTPALSRGEVRAMVRQAHVACGVPDPVAALTAGLGDDALALVAFFVSPEADLAAVMDAADRLFPGTATIGCTTAGEITPRGHGEGGIVAVGLPAAHFSARTLVVDDLSAFDPQALVGDMIRARALLGRDAPDRPHEFAFLPVDGLSVRRDELCSAILAGLGPVPLFGGSAGDGVRFDRTFVGHRGQVLRHAAVLTFVRTDCQVRVFSLDHLRPTDRRMVVTEADPARRIVRRINAEPAAREYARLLGKDPEQLSPFTFAAHPVVVRIGGRHNVRAIQRVAENGDLVFFAAIDEGLVPTLAEANRATEAARSDLDNAIKTIQEGFALFDRSDRLVLCNSRFGMHMADVREILHPGLAFDAYIDAVSRSRFLALDAGESPGDWAERRRRRHRDSHAVFNARQVWNSWCSSASTTPATARPSSFRPTSPTSPTSCGWSGAPASGCWTIKPG